MMHSHGNYVKITSNGRFVLILVVMDDALALAQEFQLDGEQKS